MTSVPRTGLVSIVGAGPGDPGLLTRKGADRLARADVVLYDSLVDPCTLALAPSARLVAVGKRAGRPGMAQEAIHRRMVLEARCGHRVVRLKGGDPFVFGRGGEEMAALEDAGVPYEIIPGLTSAIAAPALAGIPVTHRGLSSALVVVSGHAPESYEPILASLGPGTATVVVLMGLARAADIARYLVARGWAASTPAAVMYAASSPQAAEWVGRLDSLSRCAEARPPSHRRPFGAPGTIVIGQVVNVAAASARRRTA